MTNSFKKVKQTLAKLIGSLAVLALVVTSIVPSGLLAPKANAASVCPTLQEGNQLKAFGKPAIYVYTNGKLLYWPTGDFYKLWTKNNQYTERSWLDVTTECIDSLPVPSTTPLGMNPPPGTLVQRSSNPNDLYVVIAGNKRVRITTKTARALYGNNYQAFSIDPIFWPNLLDSGRDTVDSDSPTLNSFPGMVFSKDNRTYTVSDTTNTYREITASGITGNLLNPKRIVRLLSPNLAGLALGSSKVSASDTSLNNPAQGAHKGTGPVTIPLTSQDSAPSAAGTVVDSDAGQQSSPAAGTSDKSSAKDDSSSQTTQQQTPAPSPPPVATVATISPTGRNPKAFWTAKQQGVWEKIKKDYEAEPNKENPRQFHTQLYKYYIDSANCGCRWEDLGQYAGLMYQITGDKKYVGLAWKQLQSEILSKKITGNFGREYFIELVILYDWLYPGLTAAQRKQFQDKLNETARLVLTNEWDPQNPIRSDDSDKTVGIYFGLALWHLISKDYNPEATRHFNHPSIGGFTATGANRDNLRNALADYAKMGAGGTWMESSSYNLGTPKLLILGVEAVKTATGQEYFPELRALFKSMARQQIIELTPDLENSIQWGDEGNPRQLNLWNRMALLGMLQGVTQDDPQLSGALHQLIVDMNAKHSSRTSMSSRFTQRFFYLFNPYIARRDWRTSLGNSLYSSGQGFMYWGDHSSSNGKLMNAYLRPKQNYVDHQVDFFGDFQLYRQGEFAITRPQGFNFPQAGNEVNSMLIAGLSTMREARGVSAQEFGNNYAYIAGTMGGMHVRDHYWEPPKAFVDEWSRSILYLPGSTDSIVVFDRVNADAPTDLDDYGSDERAKINSAPARKQWFIHMPVSPSVGASSISWNTPKGQQASVATLLPKSQNKRIVNERSVWSAYGSERKYHVAISPKTDNKWDTFLNVVQVKNSGTVTNSLLEGSNGAQGVLLGRPGESDTAVIFNGKQGPNAPKSPVVNDFSKHNPNLFNTISKYRLLRSGYSINLTAKTASTKVMLMDLDPSRSWKLTDNGTPVALTVSRNGVGQATLSGSGSHSLVLQ